MPVIENDCPAGEIEVCCQNNPARSGSPHLCSSWHRNIKSVMGLARLAIQNALAAIYAGNPPSCRPVKTVLDEIILSGNL